MLRVIARLVLAMSLSVSPLMAQNAATVSGNVKDASGGVLPGATVDVVVAGRAVGTSTTDGDGRFRVQAPAGAPFKLQVHLTGFADQAIELSGAEGTITRDVTMQIGRVSDTLIVTASRGAVRGSAIVPLAPRETTLR